MKSSIKSVPKLRFPEFSGAWQAKKLGEILDVRYGKDYKHLKSGAFPVLGSGGVMGYVDSFLYDKPSVLIGRKGSISNPQYIDQPFWTVDTLFYTEIKDDNNPFFVYQIVKNINWLRYNEATGVPSLSASGISNVRVNIPGPKEQQKIAGFLTAVDDRVAVIDKKLKLLKKYKKGAMQKIFTQKIRFKDENGKNYPDWQEKKLGEFAKIKTGSLNVEDAQDNGEYVFFDRSQEVKKYKEYSFDNEALIYPGEGAEFLPRYFKGKYGLHQRAYAIFDSQGVDMKFLYYYMLTQNKHFLRMAVGTTANALHPLR